MGNKIYTFATMMCRKRPILVDVKPKRAKVILVDAVDAVDAVVVKPKRAKVILVDAVDAEPKRAKVILSEDDYVTGEVKDMTMDRIVGEFMRITGCDELYCKHCKRETSVKEKWMEAVVARCKRVGIHKEMEVPKTCDKQWLANKKRNPICNPINNPIYPKLVKCVEEWRREEKNRLIQKRIDGLKEVNVVARPYKYVIE